MCSRMGCQSLTFTPSLHRTSFTHSHCHQSQSRSRSEARSLGHTFARMRISHRHTLAGDSLSCFPSYPHTPHLMGQLWSACAVQGQAMSDLMTDFAMALLREMGLNPDGSQRMQPQAALPVPTSAPVTYPTQPYSSSTAAAPSSASAPSSGAYSPVPLTSYPAATDSRTTAAPTHARASPGGATSPVAYTAPVAATPEPVQEAYPAVRACDVCC